MQSKPNVLRVYDKDKHQLEIKLKDQSLLDLQKLHRDSSGFESIDNEKYLTEMHERINRGAFSLTRREEKLIKGIYGKDKDFDEAIEKPLKRGNLANVSSVSV